MNCRNHGYIQRFYQLHQHNLMSNIQMIGRLIQNQCRGLLCKGTGENDSLLFASRQCRKASVRKLLHLNPLQSFLYNLIILCIIPFQCLFVGSASHENNLPHAKIKIIIVVLGYHCYFLCRAFCIHGIKLIPVQINSPWISLQYTVYTLQKSGFSTSVWSNDPNQFFISTINRNPLQNLPGMKTNPNIFCCYSHFLPPKP